MKYFLSQILLVSLFLSYSSCKSGSSSGSSDEKGGPVGYGPTGGGPKNGDGSNFAGAFCAGCRFATRGISVSTRNAVPQYEVRGTENGYDIYDLNGVKLSPPPNILAATKTMMFYEWPEDTYRIGSRTGMGEAITGELDKLVPLTAWTNGDTIEALFNCVKSICGNPFSFQLGLITVSSLPYLFVTWTDHTVPPNRVQLTTTADDATGTITVTAGNFNLTGLPYDQNYLNVLLLPQPGEAEVEINGNPRTATSAVVALP